MFMCSVLHRFACAMVHWVLLFASTWAAPAHDSKPSMFFITPDLGLGSNQNMDRPASYNDVALLTPPSSLLHPTDSHAPKTGCS
jgi:hypothetical protein